MSNYKSNKVTPAQKEVIELLALGLSVKEIAQHLEKSVKTVDNLIQQAKHHLHLQKNNDISFDFETMIVVTDEKAVSRLVLKDCSTFIQLLRGVIRDEVRAAIPDQLINATHAKEILQVKHISSVQRYIERGKLTNYGTGTKRPKLSLRQVTQLKIEKQTTEIN